jgi:hypothetical protein
VDRAQIPLPTNKITRPAAERDGDVSDIEELGDPCFLRQVPDGMAEERAVLSRGVLIAGQAASAFWWCSGRREIVLAAW